MAVKGKSKASKNVKKSKKARSKNRGVKSTIKTLIKAAHSAIVAQGENAQEALKTAISKIDKAVKKRILHKNTASRKKSKLMKRYNASKTKG